jgi:O-acetyl-ADP-ribose deacetylase (regulator of RNase III)
MKGDITKVPVDAICNAANSELRGGGGVDGAIHAAAGGSLMLELDRIRAAKGSCPPGSAVATGAGALPAKYVFHAVGPVYRDGKHGEEAVLASAYASCLRLADEKHVQYMSFPSISTGIYGYPVAEAAPIALRTVADHLRSPDAHVQRVIFVLFDDATLRGYREALEGLDPPTG